MKKYFSDLQSRYSSLEKREQNTLLALSSFLILVFLYASIWLPVHDYVAKSQNDLDRHLKLLQYLQSTESQARSNASSQPRQESGQSLLTEISRAAQKVGIKPSRMQPEGTDAVSVWFDAVAFASLTLWLEQLESTNNIMVRQITIDGRDEPGQVSARLVLRK